MGSSDKFTESSTKYITALRQQKYCSAALIDISQVFDSMAHRPPLQTKKNLPHGFYEILKSYLTYRTFSVRYKSGYTKLYLIESGVPQGSVLGPILYQLFSSELPKTNPTTVHT